MDVLSSLNIDELPEQQTRMMHLIKEYPDFEFRLGFDACCTCGKRFDSPAVVSCPGCKRVKYCSEDCRLQDTISDTNAGVIEDGEESETAMGHSSIICTILQTCNDDDDVEGGTDAEINSMRRHAAIDRIRSEYESYPASLANVISEGPCFLDTITECKQRKTLVFHIIGASQESELSTVDQNCANKNSRFHDYAEALSNLTSIHRNINTIELVFIGPECPEVNIEYSTPIASDERNGQSKMLSARTVKGVYSKELVEESNVSPADIVVFFNPGFTVPEYEDWGSSLSSIPKGTPFLLTTNTGKKRLRK